MDLPSIDEELAQIFPNRPSGNSPHRDYSREPLTGARKKVGIRRPANRSLCVCNTTRLVIMPRAGLK